MRASCSSVTLGVGANLACPHCSLEIKCIYEHAEICKRSHANHLADSQGNVHVKSYSRSHALHRELKTWTSFLFSHLPNCHVEKGEPHLRAHFAAVEGEPRSPVRRSTAPTPLSPPTPASPPALHVSTPRNERDLRADISIAFIKEGITTQLFLDITASSIHVPSNVKDAISPAGVAHAAQLRKEKHYSVLEHEGAIIPMAFDSAGGVSNGTSSFINMIFAKNNADGGCRVWHSDQDRVKWKKRYLDTMSCIFARHRARDLILLGKVEGSRDTCLRT